MKQRDFKFHPVAIAMLLAILGILAGWAATAHADSAPGTKTAHSAEGDKPKATSSIKKSRSTRATLRTTKNEMEVTRQTKRR